MVKSMVTNVIGGNKFLSRFKIMSLETGLRYFYMDNTINTIHFLHRLIPKFGV